MQPLYKASILILPIFFAACMSTPKDKTPIEYYTPPQASNQTATIVGDMYERKYVADTIAYVFAVDQKKILNGRENLSNPLLLTAGEHELQIWCGRGGNKYTNLLKVNIEANKKYQVGYEMNPNKQQGCVFWINDLDSKKPVTNLVSGAEAGEYADPNKLRPIKQYLEPRPRIGQSYAVPIRVVNKMGR